MIRKNEPALIKATEEIFKISSQYFKVYIKVDIEVEDQIIEVLSKQKGQREELKRDSEFELDDSYYTLENGVEYKEEELIIGLQKIREYKLSKIIK